MAEGAALAWAMVSVMFRPWRISQVDTCHMGIDWAQFDGLP
jgi:hypothetical protein